MIEPELKDRYQKRFEVFQRDHFTCQLCGRRAPDVIISAVKADPGGSGDTFNMVTICDACRLGRGMSIDLRPFIKRDMLATIIEFITDHGPATATQIANELGYNRSNISNWLNKRTDKFFKSHKVENSQFYGVLT